MDQHKASLRALAKAGVDLIHLENVQGVPCCCSECSRKWLESSPKRLGYAVSARTAAAGKDRRVRTVYAAYRYDTALTRMKELRDLIKRENPRSRLSFTAHLTPRGLYMMTFGRDAFDAACIEFATAQRDWFPPEGESLLAYKIACACTGGKPVWGFDKLIRNPRPWEEVKPAATVREAEAAEDDYPSVVSEPWERINPSADRQALYLAEALAAESMVAPVTLEEQYAAKSKTTTIFHKDVIKDYYTFMRDNQRYYTDTKSIARLGVLLSVDSWLYDPLAKKAFFGLCEWLLRRHYIFDVLVAEKLRAGDLRPYEAVIVPDNPCIPRKAAELLANASGRGANILILGSCRVAGERFTPGVKLDKFLLAPSTRKPGAGKVAKLTISASDLYCKFDDPRHVPADKVENLTDGLKEVFSSGFTVMCENAWLVIGECRAKKGAVMLHLLNYNFDIYPYRREQDKLGMEKVRPCTDIDIVVPLPRGASAWSVTSLSPSHEPRRLAFSEIQGLVGFKLPQLDIYDLIVIETAPVGKSRAAR